MSSVEKGSAIICLVLFDSLELMSFMTGNDESNFVIEGRKATSKAGNVIWEASEMANQLCKHG